MIRSANDGTGSLRFTPERGVKVGHHGEDGNVDDHQRGEEEELVSEKNGGKSYPQKMPQLSLNTYDCCGKILRSAMTATIRLPKATVRSQAACSTDFIDCGACV